MVAVTSIFLDYQLPNPTTWFYISLLLAVALFFKFSRILSIRNWDILTLFLLVPGLLLIRQGHSQTSEMGEGALNPQLWFGYVWLLSGTGYFLFRCLLDLGLTGRPALNPNLNFGGLAWLAGALFVCLVSVAIQRQDGSDETVGKRSPGLNAVQNQVEQAAHQAGADDGHTWAWCTLALLCHLAVVMGLIVVGSRHFQDAHGGMAAATFYLLLPYTGLYVGQWHHVWPMALIVWAIAAYRLPTIAGFLLGLATGTVYFPALLYPLWLSFYWRRGTGRFTLAFALTALITLGAVGMVLWMQGDLGHSLRSALNLSDWQPWRGKPNTEGFWMWIDGKGVYWAYRIPIFIAYLGFLGTTTFWPSPKNLAHLLALSAALLIGIQFWYSDQGGVYVLWYLPLLLLIIFRPNLSDRRPSPISPELDWAARCKAALARRFARFNKAAEPLSRVP